MNEMKILPSNKYSLNNYPVPDSVLGVGDIAGDKTEKNLCSAGDDSIYLMGLS